MTWQTLGSLTLPTQLNRQSTQLRADMARQSVALTTGRVADPQRHLRGNLAPLAAIEARHTRASAQGAALRQDIIRFDAAQTALSRLSTLGDQLGAQLTLAATTGTAASLATTGRAALSALEDSVAALSVRAAGRAVFGGTQGDRPPIASAEDILAAATTATTGMTTAADVIAAIEAMFLTPGGVFDSSLNHAGTATTGTALPDGAPGPAAPTTADPAVRMHLMATTQAALLARDLPDLPLSERAALARHTAERLAGNAADLSALQGATGHAQARLDDARTRLRNEEDALTQARDALIGADPFEAAARLEDTRGRLEAIYAVTARISRLSLLDALR